MVFQDHSVYTARIASSVKLCPIFRTVLGYSGNTDKRSSSVNSFVDYAMLHGVSGYSILGFLLVDFLTAIHAL